MSSHSIQEISARLIDELGTILGRPLQADDGQRALHEIGVDSISLVELLVVIEKEFGLSLMEAGLSADDFRTISSLATVIHNRLQ